jgi:fucose 4-O-acetylase-like acetyltransferase
MKYITNTNNKRIEWIDCAKGITILLVIISHTVSGILRGTIFSFHMPLFFILSSLTYKCSNDKETFIRKTKKAFKHLVLPAVGILLFKSIIDIVMNYSSFSSFDVWRELLIGKLLTILFSSGVDLSIFNISISALGIPWFLIVLFMGRTLFDFIQMKMQGKKLLIVCVILTVLGILIGKVQWLPFSFDIVLAVMFFLYFGQVLKKHDFSVKPFSNSVLFACMWGSTLLMSYFIEKAYLELACRSYALFPICYLTAISGTLFVSQFSYMIQKIGRVTKIINYIGKNSLTMLIVHCMDYLWESLYINIGNYEVVVALVRVTIDIVVFSCVMIIQNLIKKN